MNTKQTLVLFILAAVLIAAAVWYSRREEAIVQKAAPNTAKVLDGVTSSTVERIEIKAPDAALVTLTRADAVWHIDAANKHRADKNLVNGLFNALEKEIKGTIVSTNPENFGEYNVNETSATRVKMFGANNSLITDLYIGKASPAFFSTFVRPAGGEQVIEANASLTYVFNKPEGWRDKTIFEMSSDSIMALEAEGTSGTFALRKIEGNWRAEKPAAGNAVANKVQALVSMISTLRANDFAKRETTQPLSDFGLEPPMQRLALTHEDRSTSPTKQVTDHLLIGKKDSEKSMFYVKRTDQDTIFTISEYQANTLTPNPDELVVKDTPTSAPAAAAATPPPAPLEPPKPAESMTTMTKPAVSATSATAAAPAPPAPPAVVVAPAPAAAPITATAVKPPVPPPLPPVPPPPPKPETQF
ncbi:MAG: DUF4340 domain-containing protein [bacterium]|nr:DUF4340 domain-containing protein [Candidatus Sumerlaeota bacterium]